MPGKQHAASRIHMRTLARVSGRWSPTRPPPTSTDDASRMGMALVMPTSEPKIRLPSTAASLHMALQKPKPVPLRTERKEARVQVECSTITMCPGDGFKVFTLSPTTITITTMLKSVLSSKFLLPVQFHKVGCV